MNNQQLFRAQYKQALIKVGVGIHVIRIVGKQENVSEDQIEHCIEQWAKVLADGLRLPLPSVIEDGKNTCDNFPVSFTASPEFNQIMKDLSDSMLAVNAIPGKS